ncbi:TonB-dependent receptor [Crocinitomicaceae bacterium]|nr:TonB-dependent receptor [Crocinitomicaceae bacterium]
MIRDLILIAIVLLPWSLFAQLTQTIRGNVIDRYSEQFIPGARVYVFGEGDSLKQIADLDGVFRFENVKVGRYTVIASMSGYEELVLTNLELISTKEMVLELKITEKVQNVNEVTVKAKEEGETVNKLATVSARSFSVEESQRYAGSFNDVARMAQNFAGVQGADDSRNDIVIRGNSPTGVLFRMEGMDIPNPNHFARFGTTGGPVSMLNNNILANSDFFTGAFPAEYGNALAGVFDLKIRNGNNEKFEFMGQIGFNGLEGMAEGPISKEKGSSFLVNYRYSTLELFTLIGLDFGTSATPKYQDGTFKLRFPDKKGVTQVFGLGGTSKVNIITPPDSDANEIFGFTGTDIRFKTSTGMLGITRKQRINSNSFFEVMAGVQAAYNLTQFDTLGAGGGNPFTTFMANSTIGKQTTSFNYQNKISSRHLIKTGVTNDIYFLDLKDSTFINDSVGFNSNRDFDGATALVRPHFQHRFRITEDLTLVSGVYAQFLTLGNQLAIEPRVGLNYSLKKRQRISVGYGMHSQMAPIELYYEQVQLTDGSYITPKKDIGFTRSQHLIAGYQKRFKYGIQLKTEIYGQYLTNVPVESQSSSYSLLNFGASFNTGTPDYLVNEGKGYNYGVELTLEKFLDKGFYFLVTGSLFESKYQGSDKVWRNTAFNSNHTLNVLGGYEIRFNAKKPDAKYKSALSFDLKFVWNGGGRYTPVLIDESIAAGKEVLDFNNTFASGYADYLKGNARTAFKLIGKKTTQEWVIDIQNFTDRDNIFYQEFDVKTGGLRTTFQNGLLWVFQYRITF